jgi:TP901 family phage tail tape measure protein
MIKGLEVAVILSAVDRMSQVFNTAVNASSAKLKEFQKNYKESFQTGTILMGAGTALALSLAPAINAYADLEDSSTRLKTVMMQDGAVVSQNFEKVNAIAVELGNKLPGTTADFQNMFSALLRGGVAEKSILEGVGKASAYLAVGLKVPYEEAAKLTAKLKEATGVSNGEMLDFMDTIARVNNLGVETGEMQFAFSRSAGALKLLNIQGLEASKSIASVYAQLIKTGASGETVGTGMTSVFNSFFDDRKMGKFNKAAASLGLTFDFVDKKTGQFKGVENMIAQFDRLREFNPKQRATLVQALLGPGQDAQFMNTLINQGIGGYNEMQKRMANQATLNAKVDEQLGTLRNIWEAATGTFTNALASFGKALAPELKLLTKLFGWISEALIKFSEQHPKLMKFIGLFIAITSVILTLVGAVLIAKAAFFALNAVLMANPFIFIIAAVIALAVLIYVYWDDIAAFFVKIWGWISKTFFTAWEWIKGVFKSFMAWFMNWGKYILIPLAPFIALPLLIYKNWDSIAGFFTGLWDRVKVIFLKVIIWIFNFHQKFYNAGRNIVLYIWDGIKSLASKPVEAIKAIVQKMRNFLPFSPAKEGPFRDLHRVKIIETIAQSMKPAPMLAAMNSVTQAARSQISGRGGLSLVGSTTGGAAVTIHYNPSITISGAVGNSTKEDFLAELRKHSSELTRMLNEIMERRERTKF